MNAKPLPIPFHHEPERVDQVWRVAYQERAADAVDWARKYQIVPSVNDQERTALMLVDVQNTFCIPGFELFVGGADGRAAVKDNQRLCAFIYRHLNRITEICATMDTHQAAQIFHAMFLIDDAGHHPQPYSIISIEEIEEGRWRFNPKLTHSLGISAEYGQTYLQHYVQKLARNKKYELTIWPYHAMLGGIGHALVPAVEEAVFFHSLARSTQPDFQVKGRNPLTENYSVLKPEVMEDAQEKTIARKNTHLIHKLLEVDRLIIAGQAKSHCVAWTVSDLLEEIRARDPQLAGKVYLLEDCSSPVVIPGAIDYTQAADEAFDRFARAGMHRVRSTDMMDSWPVCG